MTVAEHSVRLPGGRTIQYEVDESVPFAVATLVYDGEHVFLTRQYRYPIGQWIFDLPGGAGEVDEEPIEAARRELEEELGLVAVDLRPLHSFYVNPGRSAWPVHVFACTSTSEGSAHLDDPIEQVRLVSMTVAQLDSLIASGEIVDPTLLIARAMAAVVGFLPRIGGGKHKGE
jgi:ADP-ribose pyrophosphatase